MSFSPHTHQITTPLNSRFRPWNTIFAARVNTSAWPWRICQLRKFILFSSRLCIISHQRTHLVGSGTVDMCRVARYHAMYYLCNHIYIHVTVKWSFVIMSSYSFQNCSVDLKTLSASSLHIGHVGNKVRRQSAQQLLRYEFVQLQPDPWKWLFSKSLILPQDFISI